MQNLGADRVYYGEFENSQLSSKVFRVRDWLEPVLS